jgi:5-methylcytosine-specific restriction endonuclease McrA
MAIDKSRYSKNWGKIRKAILARAGNCCEECGIANGAPIPRATSTQGSMFPPSPPATDLFGDPIQRVSRVVLTIAHLDHTPENCEPENLKALCQRHHLAYDLDYHVEEGRKTREAKKPVKPQSNLF